MRKLAKERSRVSWWTSDNDYDLSINKYKKIEYIPVEYPPTEEILAEIEQLNEQIAKETKELREMLAK